MIQKSYKTWLLRIGGTIGIGGFFSIAVFLIGWYLGVEDYKRKVDDMAECDPCANRENISDNHEELEDVESHIPEIHQLQMTVARLEGALAAQGIRLSNQLHVIEVDLNEVEEIQNTAIRRDSVSKAVDKITKKGRTRFSN